MDQFFLRARIPPKIGHAPFFSLPPISPLYSNGNKSRIDSFGIAEWKYPFHKFPEGLHD